MAHIVLSRLFLIILYLLFITTQGCLNIVPRLSIPVLQPASPKVHGSEASSMRPRKIGMFKRQMPHRERMIIRGWRFSERTSIYQILYAALLQHGSVYDFQNPQDSASTLSSPGL